MAAVTFERRAAAQGDEGLMDVVEGFNRARRGYAAAGMLKRALFLETVRDLVVEEANIWSREVR